MSESLALKITKATREELPAAVWSFVYFFTLLASYYVLRPIRDEMAIQIGVKNLPSLFTYVFVTMLALVPIFGWLTAAVPRRKLLPWLYAFFVLNLLGFYVVMQAGEQSLAVAHLFYIWASVFNLFAVSVFWSFMADCFKTDQAKRLYGFIAAGGTLGALAGPLLTSQLVQVLGAKNMMLVSAGLLSASIVAIFRIKAWLNTQALSASANTNAKTANEAQNLDATLKGGLLSGIVDIAKSPYLLGICLFLFCFALLSTFLYSQQTLLVPAAITNSADRIQFLSYVDLAVNVLTLLIQVFAFGALIQRLGILPLLVAMPLVSVLGFAALALFPGLWVLVVFGVIRRAGEYAVSKPARETLFNVLPPDQKYKAKNVIDTLVHRTGDTASIWLFDGLKKAGMSLSTMTWLAVPVAVLWFVVSWYLGKAAAKMQRSESNARL
jgi:ATP:ADP antiporter, AAA family